MGTRNRSRELSRGLRERVSVLLVWMTGQTNWTKQTVCSVYDVYQLPIFHRFELDVVFKTGPRVRAEKDVEPSRPNWVLPCCCDAKCGEGNPTGAFRKKQRSFARAEREQKQCFL